MKDVFISYHMNSSTDIVEKISAALDGAGISNWYAKQDIAGGYAGAIVEAINECKVFLIVLNQYSTMSPHCLNEINIMYDRLSRKEEVTILPFKIDKCELSKDVYYYLGRMRMFDGTLPPELERVAELVDRISNILNRQSVVEKWVNEGSSAEKKNYAIVGSSISKNNSFVGRKAELELIHQKMSENPHKVFMIGMGGIGKSEIAKEYCDKYRQEYDAIIWVSYEQSLIKTITNDFAFQIKGIDRSEFAGEDDKEYFIRKLKVLKEIADEKVLIVVDNFDVLEDECLEDFCTGRYSVLFTSRYHEVCGDIPEVEINEMTNKEELFELFLTEYTRNLEEEDEGIVEELLNMLDGHPLSIRLVASTMESNRISPEKMLEIMRAENELDDRKSKKAIEKMKARMKQLYSISSLSEEEQYILKNLVLMPLSGVDVEAFYEWCDLDEYEIIDSLIQKSWVVHNKAEDKVHLHPIVKDVMAAELAADPECCRTLLESMEKEIADVSRTTFKERKRYVECYNSAFNNLPMEHPLSWNVAFGNAVMLMLMSRFEEGQKKMIELYGETNDLTYRLDIANRVSQGYNLVGIPETGIQWAEKGLELIEGIPVEDLSKEQRRHRKYLYIRLNEANRTLGNYDASENYLRMLIEDNKRFPNEVDLNTNGWQCLGLARVLALKETEASFKESTELMEESKRLFTTAKNKAAIGYVNMFYGMLNMYEGKYEEAFEKTAKAEEIFEKTIGTEHVDLGKLKLFEANIYRAKGEEDKAIKAYRQAEEMMIQRNSPLLAQKVREVMESGKIGYTN